MINASRSGVRLILSARFNFVAISLASLLIEDAMSGVIFLYVFVIFFGEACKKESPFCSNL